ncbi:lysoplasmalogenase [Sandaracinus amylolyticus]|uniref:lysoplasmalogenase n=1 Tax=Sandaracinus amylolyticus TaxID=927083 RepID=UPI001F19C5EC|nr:lysoplasmalogenase [Sandaracinus amylolyticus]
MSPRALATVALVSGALFVAGVVIDSHALRMLTKPLPVIAIALWIVRAAPPSAYRRAIVLGLGASLAGDVLLELASGIPALASSLFIAGLLAFLVAHVLYVRAYTSDTRALHPMRALPAYAYGALMLVALWPGVGGMALPVTLYTLVICTMLWRAAARVGHVDATSARLALTGAIVFALSDSMIALGRFGTHLVPETVRTGWPLRVAIITTYWLGQWAIAASAKR